jgi:ssDNA-binding Zn-finger/Zn-ribbon topoisomerase 1
MEPRAADQAQTGRRPEEGAACPRCGALRVHRSHRRGLSERALAMAGNGGIRRCHACQARFALFGNSIIYVEDARRAMRTFARVAVLVASAGLLVAAIVR